MQVEFAWYGGSPDIDVRGMVERFGLTPYVRYGGLVGHAEALRQMQAASVLLTLQSPEDDIHVPGKLFEYMGAGRPIFAVSRPCEVTEMIARHRLGWVAEPNAAAVQARLQEIHARWETAGHDGLKTSAADRFNVQETTQQLAALLETVGAR